MRFRSLLLRRHGDGRIAPALARVFLLTALLPGLAPALTFPLPPPGNNVVGQIRTEVTRAEDTFSDIARRNDLGYREFVAANPQYDPWIPGAGVTVQVPTLFILPDAPRDGIVINLAELRLYYYPKGKGVVITHPLGIGREGWQTPVGNTRISEKIPNPTWTPPESIRAEHAAEGNPLPEVVPAGPDNPLGAYAMRLALPGYLIHGTNRPFGVGMRVSHGCIRLYPEDIKTLFQEVPRGTPVHIVNQPYKAGLQAGLLYVESHDPLEEEQTEGTNLTPLVNAILAATGGDTHDVDWEQVRIVARQHKGIPVPITPLSEVRAGADPVAPEPAKQEPPPAAPVANSGSAPTRDSVTKALMNLSAGTASAPATAVPAAAVTLAQAPAPSAGNVDKPVPQTPISHTAAPSTPQSGALFDPTAIYGKPAFELSAPRYGQLPPGTRKSTPPAAPPVSATPPPPEPAPVAPSPPPAIPKVVERSISAGTPATAKPPAAPVIASPKTPRLDPTRSWFLHMGVFSDAAGIARIREDLTRLGFAVRVTEIEGVNLQRVVAGPFASANAAMEARVRIREAVGIEPTLLPPGS